MVLTRLTGRTACPFVACVSAALLFSIGSCSSSVSPANVRAEESKEEEADPDFAVPDGTPEEIQATIKQIQTRQSKKKFANRQEFIDQVIKMHRAMIVAGDKILAQETEDKVAADAAQMKLGSLTTLAANDVGETPKEALEAVTKLKGDKREAVADVAEKFWLPIRIVNAKTLNADGRKALIEEVVASASTSKFSRDSVDGARKLGDVLTDMDKTEEAGELFDQLSKAAEEATEPRLRRNAEVFAATARRLRLPGNFLELDGKTVDGMDFDWASYRGKVVLVDFWATWCGPCMAELPNVKAAYDKYHDKGFDVVGISLDNARLALTEFIEKEKLPWAQLYDEDKQRGNGWNHPMVKKYGISGIPAAILVDKDGKVISMAARGDDLEKLIAKHLDSK